MPLYVRRKYLIACLLIWSVCMLLCTSANAQKQYNVLDWKPEYSLNSFLLQQMHAQYDARKISFNRALVSRTAAQQYVADCRRRAQALFGQRPDQKGVPEIKLTGTIRAAGYRIEKLLYKNNGHHVTASLYLPATDRKLPAIVLLCGHEDIAKATPSYQQTAILFAKNGFVVFVIDPLSQGERYQLTDKSGKPLTRGGTTEHTLLNQAANLLGTSMPADELWDNMRGIDYLVARKEVDSTRIGCIGNSGGGIQTIYLAAMDKRIKAFAPCSYLASRERTLELTGPADGCAQVPGEGRLQLEMNDFLLAAAPSPMLILAGRFDFIDYRGTEDAFHEQKQLYTVLGYPNNTTLFTYDDGHGISKPKREFAVSWFRKQFYKNATQIREPELQLYTPQELQVTTTGQLNSLLQDEETLPQRNLRLFESGAEKRKHFASLPGNDLKNAIAKLLGINITGKLAADSKGTVKNGNITYHKWIVRKEGEIPLPLLIAYPDVKATKLTIYTGSTGKNRLADSADFINGQLRSGSAVILCDVRGTGETTDKAEFNDPKYYNRDYRNVMLALHTGTTLTGQRTTDLLSLIDFVKTDSALVNLPIEIHADGAPALAALHTLLFRKEISALYIDARIRSFREILERPAEQDWYAYVIPGILDYYDIPDLVKIAGAEKIRYTTTGRKQ